MVRDGSFRSDLFYRMNTFNIHLPPLREREQDIEKIAISFVFSICRRNRLLIKGVAPETLETLASYPWPGNVRELGNTLEKAILANPEDPVLYPIHLSPEIRLCRIRSMVSQKHEEATASPLPAEIPYPKTLPPLKEYRRLLAHDLENDYLQRLLKDTKGDIAKACTVSGLSRSRLYGLIKIHSLSITPDFCPK